MDLMFLLAAMLIGAAKAFITGFALVAGGLLAAKLLLKL